MITKVCEGQMKTHACMSPALPLKTIDITVNKYNRTMSSKYQELIKHSWQVRWCWGRPRAPEQGTGSWSEEEQLSIRDRSQGRSSADSRKAKMAHPTLWPTTLSLPNSSRCVVPR